MICLTSTRGRLLNVSIAINRSYCNSLLCILFIHYFSLFLLLFLFVVYFCMYVFFSSDVTILVNKDVYYSATGMM